jgi:hypothetical protein
MHRKDFTFRTRVEATLYTDRGFPQTLDANCGILPRSGNDSVLADLFHSSVIPSCAATEELASL